MPGGPGPLPSALKCYLFLPSFLFFCLFLWVCFAVCIYVSLSFSLSASHPVFPSLFAVSPLLLIPSLMSPLLWSVFLYVSVSLPVFAPLSPALSFSAHSFLFIHFPATLSFSFLHSCSDSLFLRHLWQATICLRGLCFFLYLCFCLSLILFLPYPLFLCHIFSCTLSHLFFLSFFLFTAI